MSRIRAAHGGQDHDAGRYGGRGAFARPRKTAGRGGPVAGEEVRGEGGQTYVREFSGRGATERGRQRRRVGVLVRGRGQQQGARGMLVACVRGQRHVQDERGARRDARPVLGAREQRSRQRNRTFPPGPSSGRIGARRVVRGSHAVGDHRGHQRVRGRQVPGRGRTIGVVGLGRGDAPRPGGPAQGRVERPDGTRPLVVRPP